MRQRIGKQATLHSQVLCLTQFVSTFYTRLVPGYRLGCGIFNSKPADLSGVSLEDIAVNLDNESLLSLEDSSENSVDRYGVNYKDEDENSKYPTRPYVYSDEKLYDAFDYDGDNVRGSLRPAHRPFIDNGPAIVEEEEIHDRYISSLRERSKITSACTFHQLLH